ncbi:MAG TPA: 4Fe-4S binding protein [Planctomycetota bacterium]|nr:4Fe-4S binding protein [Planctomycetota bacterium]
MRLDFFLPFLRRPPKGQPPRAPGALTRVAKKILPAALFSDDVKPGLLRRFWKKTGPTWLSSPVRRIIQSLCFIAFLGLFFHVCWPYSAQPLEKSGEWPSHYADELARKEVIAAEAFLIIDPLLSLSTALAAKAWVWSLVWAGVIVAVCVIFPRGFCGYICPLGTLIDCFDWAIGKRVTRFNVKHDGWWVNLKYYILLGTLIAAMFGVLLSGFVAAIPVVTRGLLFTLAPLQMGALRGWHQVPPLNAGHYVSLVLFFAVLAMGFWRPRFWCRYVCPSGAVFSVANFWRVTERKVESSCINCNKCVEICPFDAIKADFTTRTADCTLCQTCGGVCPTHAIKFVDRWDITDLKKENDPETHEIPLARRGFMAGALSSLALAFGVKSVFGASLAKTVPVRPPGSVPEEQFLQMCIRCGECFKACPNNVLQPMGFTQGLEGLWTPEVVANWSGCESSCNACGQVCPTGAIRALPLEEKKSARMGLAIINEKTCLPFAGREACQMCVDECTAAGYNAMEFIRVGVQTDDNGLPIDGSGFAAPVVLADKCVGCGLCQTRCHQINVKSKGLLQSTAIWVEAGEGKEDRLMSGSYIELRKNEASSAEGGSEKKTPGEKMYLPDFLK